jgi:hypothetical protein
MFSTVKRGTMLRKSLLLNFVFSLIAPARKLLPRAEECEARRCDECSNRESQRGMPAFPMTPAVPESSWS